MTPHTVPHPALVIDVGMHNGDDTAYYLHRGYRVVAIEANPAWVVRGAQRFRAAIQAGRLRILPVGIAAERGTAEFFIAPGLDVLSSFHPGMAQRAGTPIERVSVTCAPIADILAEHGVPWYMKVDIEGNDSLCVAGLTSPTAPTYLSIELDPQEGSGDVARLAALGYTRFKCVRQNDLREITAHNLPRQLALRRGAAASGLKGGSLRLLRTINHRLVSRRLGKWRFPAGSSGAFGPDLPGPWLDAEALLRLWHPLVAVHQELATGWRSEWFDLHCSRYPHS